MYSYHLLLILFFIASDAAPCVKRKSEDVPCDTTCTMPKVQRSCGYYGRNKIPDTETACVDGTPVDQCRQVTGYFPNGGTLNVIDWANTNTPCNERSGSRTHYRPMTDADIGGMVERRARRALKKMCLLPDGDSCNNYNERTAVIVKVPGENDRNYLIQTIVGTDTNVVICAKSDADIGTYWRRQRAAASAATGSATLATASSGQNTQGTGPDIDRMRIFSVTHQDTPAKGGLLAVAQGGRNRRDTVAVHSKTGGSAIGTSPKKARMEYKTNRLYDDYQQQSAAQIQYENNMMIQQQDDDWRYEEAVINVDIALKQLKLAKVMRKHHKKMRGYY